MAAQTFREALESRYRGDIQRVLDLLHARFAQSGSVEGYRKGGHVAVAKFELGEADEPQLREAGTLRQREASGLIEQLLARIGKA